MPYETFQEAYQAGYKEALEHKNIDLEGKDCPICKKEKLHPASLQDDWSGILSCSNCGEKVYKWVTIPDHEDIKKSLKKGFEEGVRTAKMEILQDFSDYISDMKIKI